MTGHTLRQRRALREALVGVVVVSATLLLVACDQGESIIASGGGDTSTVKGRWYSVGQVQAGEGIFREHCQECHGEKAAGTVDDWRQPLAEGKYPPPPLNGSAHAWHHPLPMLMRTLERGGIPLGGTMPAFADKLDEEERYAVIAYIQSLWSNEIYSNWQRRSLQDR